MIRLFTVCASALALAACTVGPDFSAPAPRPPAGWRPAVEPAELQLDLADGPRPAAQWWTVFGDSRLDDLQARALAASPDLRTAALHFAQSRMQRTTVAAQRGPAVNASAAASGQRQSEYSAATRMIDIIAPGQRDEIVSQLSDPIGLYQAGFDASWELDLWGRVARSVEAADAGVAAAGALLDEARLSIASEVARNYFELRGAQRQEQLARQDIAAADASLALLQAMADGGQLAQLDATRQRALVADLHGRLPPLLAQQSAAANRIALLLGVQPGSLDLGAPAERDAAIPDLSLGLPSEVARQRADIRAAEAQLHAATASVGLARADLYPRIVLGASFGLESYQAGKFGDWGSRQWAVGPQLELPVFDMGRRRSVVALRELEQQEAAVAFQRTVLKAWQEVDDALAAYAAERNRNRQLRAKVDASGQAFDLARARYEGGLTDFLAPLDAQRTLLQARRDLVQSEALLRVDLVAVYKAIGAGSDAAQAAAAPPAIADTAAPRP